MKVNVSQLGEKEQKKTGMTFLCIVLALIQAVKVVSFMMIVKIKGGKSLKKWISV